MLPKLVADNAVEPGFALIALPRSPASRSTSSPLRTVKDAPNVRPPSVSPDIAAVRLMFWYMSVLSPAVPSLLKPTLAAPERLTSADAMPAVSTSAVVAKILLCRFTLLGLAG